MNRRVLEEAKMTGYEMEDVANDIKFNLRQQSAKLEKSILAKLYEM